MQVTTIAEARALVGRTFERDGELRCIDALGEWLFEFRWGNGSLAFKANGTVSEMAHWLSGATEIESEVSDA